MRAHIAYVVEKSLGSGDVTLVFWTNRSVKVDLTSKYSCRITISKGESALLGKLIAQPVKVICRRSK